MGFMDKARKLAEQAQEKLDEVQKQAGASRGAADQADTQEPVVEYDEHGRRIPPVQVPDAPGPPAPASVAPASPAPPSAAPPPVAAPTAPAAPAPAPATPAADAPPDVDRSEYEPPAITSGDPLAG
jgi:hypothetical protein